MPSIAVMRILSVTTLLGVNPVLPESSSVSDFLMPVKLKRDNLGLSTTLISTSISIPFTSVK